MSRRWRYFAMFADMRTGSNFLEENINQFADLRCHGELFNPGFVGNLNRDEKFGIDKAARDREPLTLIDAMVDDDPAVLPGFRLFSDHDPRVIAHCLRDPSCAKVILRRNPLESFISNRIAAETDQWRMTNVKTRREVKIRFDAARFEAYLAERLESQASIQHELQVTGQTAFNIHYDDIHDLDVLNGLARFLGSGERIEKIFNRLKKQNPGSLTSKVSNPDEMEAALARMDLLRLHRIPDFEPRRGPMVPGYFAGRAVPFLCIPLRGGPVGAVRAWAEAHERAAGGEGLVDGFNQKTLRHWKRNAGHYASFAVVRHPVARAHAVFASKVLGPRDESRDLLRLLARVFDVEIPQDPSEMDDDARRAAFKGFLRFLGANLSGQTALRVDPLWASQAAVIEGATHVSPIHRLIREADAETALGEIEADLGLVPQPYAPDPDMAPAALAAIYDEEIEKLARDAYARDYLGFGFGNFA